MLKKITSGILTICLLASALTACKTATTSGQESSAAKSSASGSSIQDGGKITVYSNYGGLQNATKPSDTAYVEKMKAYIKEQTGIEVNFIAPPKDAAADKEKLNLLLSSGAEIDTFKGDIATYATSGAIQPIGELVEKYGANLKKLWPETWAGGWAGMKTMDGKIWGVPELPALAGCTVYFRDDWLTKTNVAMPKTTAEMKAALIAIKAKDPAGNGQTIPLLADMRGLNMAMASGWMDVGYSWDNRGFMDADGVYKPMVFAPGYKEFIAEMAEWYKEGLIYKESFTINKDRQLELGKTNRVASYCMWYTTATVPVEQMILDGTIANISIKVADPLTGPKGLTKSMSDTSQTGWVVSKSSKNPEGVIKYINWVQANLTNYLTVMMGFEGDTWAYEENKPDGMSSIKRLNPDVVKYNAEFMAGSSFAYTKRFVTTSGGKIPVANQYISNFITDNTKCKLPSTFGFSFLMNKQEIIKQVGNLEDMITFLDAGTVKFIMGSRPMSEWDTFLKEIEKVGLKKWEDAYTAEYKKAKK